MMVEFKEGERKRTIHKMKLSNVSCIRILKYGTIRIGNQNYKIIDSHLNNLDALVPSYGSDDSYQAASCLLPDAEILPDAEFYVQKA